MVLRLSTALQGWALRRKVGNPPSELTLDLTCPFELVGSSSPGHAHLFLDTVISWHAYTTFLHRLRVAGVIEEGYLRMSLRREATHLRLPWAAKELGRPRHIPADARIPGTLPRELLVWTINRYLVEDYFGSEEVQDRIAVPSDDVKAADLVSSRLVGNPGMHAPMLDLDDGARIDPLSGRLVLNVQQSRRSHRLIRKAFAQLGVLREIEDTPPPPLPRLR